MALAIVQIGLAWSLDYFSDRRFVAPASEQAAQKLRLKARAANVIAQAVPVGVVGEGRHQLRQRRPGHAGDRIHEVRSTNSIPTSDCARSAWRRPASTSGEPVAAQGRSAKRGSEENAQR